MGTAKEIPLLCPSCHTSRRSCSCHRRNHDPIHSALRDAEIFIDEVIYFGHEAKETAFSLIQSAKCHATTELLAGRLDGFDKIRIDKDAERLIDRVKGKLFGTAQRMRDREADAKAKGIKTPAKQKDGLSNIDRLRKQAALYGQQTQANA